MPGYTFHPNASVPASLNLPDQRPYLTERLTARQRAAVCDATPGCAGFDSGGLMKSAIQLAPWPHPEWYLPGPCDGVFAKQCE